MTDGEDGSYDSMNDFKLQTSTGSDISDLSVLKTALKDGNVVVSI